MEHVSVNIDSQAGNQRRWLALWILVPVWLVMQSNTCNGSKTATDADSTANFRFGFWNVENLFDTRNDPYHDDDFTPGGANHWNADRYSNKLHNLSKVIAALKADVLGLAEVENRAVLDDLVKTDEIRNANYQIVHFDSPDERGIDVACLFKESVIRLLHAEKIPVTLEKNDKTRDILYAQFRLVKSGDTIHYFVNHWPSRREGQSVSAAKRMRAATTLRTFLDNRKLNKNVILCGDFNDNPKDSSIQSGLGACYPSRKDTACYLYNLSALLSIKKGGSLKFGHRWDLFDQLIISHTFWDSASSPGVYYGRYSTTVFNPTWMQEKGKNAGAPWRTFKGNNYQNGYSDHFPVYAELIYEQKK